MANWRWVWAHGVNQMINFDKIDAIVEAGNGRAILEWGNGQCQLTLDEPKFKELQHELEEASKSGK